MKLKYLYGIFFFILMIINIINPKTVISETYNLSLDESIKIGEEHNRQLNIARAEITNTQAALKEARSYFFPIIHIEASYVRLDEAPIMRIEMPANQFTMDTPMGLLTGETTASETEISMGEEDNYNTKFIIQQPIFTGFRIINNYHLSNAKHQASLLEYELTEVDLIYQIAEAYYNLQKAIAFSQIADEIENLISSHYEDIQNLYKQGIVSYNEVLKIEVEKSHTQLGRIQANNTLHLAKASLCYILGLPLDTELNLTDNLTYIEEEIPSLEIATQSALTQRKELELFQEQQNMSNCAISIARSGWFPNIYFAGSYEYKKPNRYNENEWGTNWSVMVTAQMDLWNWGRTYYQTQQAKAQAIKLEENILQFNELIQLEVMQSYFYLQEAKARVQEANQGVKSAEENYRSTKDRFQEQMATNTELLDAETALNRAKTEYIQALADYHTARIGLKMAMGELYIVNN